MAHRISLEILELIFSNLVHDLLEEKKVREARKLRLVSKSVQKVVDRFLYRKIEVPSGPSRMVQRFCDAMIERRRIAPWVQEVSLEQTDEEDREESEEEPEEESDSGGPAADPKPVEEFRKVSHADKLAAAKELLKSKFRANGQRIHSEEDWIKRLSDRDIVKWAFMLQLPNLVTLTLETRKGRFAETATLLRLPRLQNLTLTIDVGPEGKYTADVPFEEVLESIISSTDRLKSLAYEDKTGSCSFPKTHNAPKLKRILDKHAAQTLEYLDIALAMNDEKDWRLPQEYTDISGCFGSMQNFIKLEELYIQFEVLLGRPEASQHRLKDVLPADLKVLTCVSIYDYHGNDPVNDGPVWAEPGYLPHFTELAEAAEDSQRFASLDSVKVDRYRKDEFNPPQSGNYVDGVLGRSRISFGWY
jgi:hypothetical protein